MIEVFKTNVNDKRQAHELVSMLSQKFVEAKINFDLEDCDKVLRIESTQIHNDSIVNILVGAGFTCEQLK
jgi:hypothetical protein